MPIPTVQQVVDRLLSTLGWGSVIAFFVSLSWFLIKTKSHATDFITRVSSEWKEAREDIKEAKQKLDTATSNHLTHIEVATATTVALMERQNGLLERIIDGNTENSITLGKIQSLLGVYTSK